jgi:trigger factor
MNIEQKNIDELNAVITVKLSPEDYQDNYNRSINKYRKEMRVPGFRPGHVPAALVKKKYGPSILAEEVDKLLNEALYNHIQSSNLDILGQPLPANTEEKIDWHNPNEMEFSFEIGLAPQFELQLNGKTKFIFNKIKVDDELVNKQINDFAKRYGKLAPVDKSEATDMIWATFSELDANDQKVEGGFTHSSTVSVEYIDNKDIQKKLIGLKVDDTLIIDPKSISRGDADMAAMLGIAKDKAAEFNNNVELKVTEIKRLHPAEVDQELIDKVYGPGEVDGVEAFKEKIRTELSQMFTKDSDRLFKRDLADTLLEKLKLNLPSDFLKKWIVATNKKEVTMEQVESEFDQYAISLKWQLIENKIIKDNAIKVTAEEVINYTKELLAMQYAQYGMMVPVEEELTAAAKKVLANQDESSKLYETLYEMKVTAFLKENASIEENEISYDDFVKKAQKA